MISRVLAASPASIHPSFPRVSVSNTPSLPVRIPSGVRKVATRGARRFFRFVLARCLPYSCSRESVQSASDCRIQTAPPPLTPEMAISASGRSASLTVLKFPCAPPLAPRAPSLLARPAKARLLCSTPPAASRARLLRGHCG
ncbi:MAG: hypothetical protein ACK56F_02735, partial [bacterium]